MTSIRELSKFQGTLCINEGTMDIVEGTMDIVERTIGAPHLHDPSEVHGGDGDDVGEVHQDHLAAVGVVHQTPCIPQKLTKARIYTTKDSITPDA
jgi:hypothetical protein